MGSAHHVELVLRQTVHQQRALFSAKHLKAATPVQAQRTLVQRVGTQIDLSHLKHCPGVRQCVVDQRHAVASLTCLGRHVHAPQHRLVPQLCHGLPLNAHQPTQDGPSKSTKDGAAFLWCQSARDDVQAQLTLFFVAGGEGGGKLPQAAQAQRLEFGSVLRAKGSNGHGGGLSFQKCGQRRQDATARLARMYRGRLSGPRGGLCAPAPGHPLRPHPAAPGSSAPWPSSGW